MQPWMIYGANGYTGELIAREAVRRGHRPILAGRHAAKIEPLARELGCDARVFDLDRVDLAGAALVLHCAGPFSITSAPMVEACLRGVGFDVVPTDCLAAMLADHLPGATELLLAFYTKGSALSRGTTRTMIESIGDGGAIRRDGRIVRVPFAYGVRTIPFSCGERTAMTIPWGDVSTAFHTTGIPNIRVYLAASPKAIARTRRLRWVLPLLSPKPIRRLLQKVAAPRGGPDERKRAAGRVYLWGEVSNGTDSRAMTMTTPEGYAFTILSAVNAGERVLAGARPGAFTPAALLGSDFVSTVPGVLFN